MLVSAYSLIRSDLLPLNPILFICNFPVHFFFIRQRQRVLLVNIQIQAKGRLNKLLPLLLFFGCFRPMPLHNSLLAKRKFERLLCRTPFLFHFQLPSTIFYKHVKILKNTKVFTSKLFPCVPN